MFGDKLLEARTLVLSFSSLPPPGWSRLTRDWPSPGEYQGSSRLLCPGSSFPCTLVTPLSSGVDPASLLVPAWASWSPCRSFTFTQLIYLGSYPRRAVLCLFLSSALSSFPACGSQAVPVLPSLRGSAQCSELTPFSDSDVSAFPVAACSSTQAPASLQQTSAGSPRLCLPELGRGKQACESPCFPLCPRCWLQALSRAAAELQATAQVIVTLSSLYLGLSQLFPGWARPGKGRNEMRRGCLVPLACLGLMSPGSWALGLEREGALWPSWLACPSLLFCLLSLDHQACQDVRWWGGDTEEPPLPAVLGMH